MFLRQNYQSPLISGERPKDHRDLRDDHQRRDPRVHEAQPQQHSHQERARDKEVGVRSISKVRSE